MSNERFELRISTPTLKRWRTTAALEELSLSAWIRQCCEAHAIDQDTLEVLAKRVESKKARR